MSAGAGRVGGRERLGQWAGQDEVKRSESEGQD